jgi:inosine-uridine nucleoside N-ribohydrolase
MGYPTRNGEIALKHVIIDTDPGVDDALAILLAFSSPELHVEGLTTVIGNVSLEKGNLNALKLLEFLGVDDIPVASGAEKPLLWSGRDASSVHGETGLGGATLPEPKGSLDDRGAVDFILEKVDELGRELILVPIGPLTNIAEAILARPGIAEETLGLVIMGGAFNLTPYGQGNVTPVAEFNIWHDPEAAKIVFDSGIPITAIGLDVTTDPSNRLLKPSFKEIEALGTRRAKFVSDLCRPLIEKSGGVSLHDPLAVASVIDPTLIGTESVHVEVETRGEVTRGMTLVDQRRMHRGEPKDENVDVCVSVDGPRFLEMISERVVGGL